LEKIEIRKINMDIFAEPLIDVPVGKTSRAKSDTADLSDWNKMTLKDIFEDENLFKITILSDNDEKNKTEIKYEEDAKESMDCKTKTTSYEPRSAFLGPKIWEKPISMSLLQEMQDEQIKEETKPRTAFMGPKLWKKPISINLLQGIKNEKPKEETNTNHNGNVSDFSVMSLNDFLEENQLDAGNISMSEELFEDAPIKTEDVFSLNGDCDSRGRHDSASSHHSDYSMMDHDYQATVTSPGQTNIYYKSTNILPKGENSFLYKESKRAKLEREKEERKQQLAIVEFSQQELAWATVPGEDFDPTEREFSVDELRPQPIIRKRKKVYVNPEKKDMRYWESRQKNNVAARRSREARRLKENQVSLRASFLESENVNLRNKLHAAKEKQEENTMQIALMKAKLQEFESIRSSLNDCIK